MTPRSGSRSRTVLLVAALALGAAACGDGDSDTADAPDPTDAATTTTTDVAAVGTGEDGDGDDDTDGGDTAPADTAAESSVPATEPAEVAPPSGADCVPGTWTLRSQEFLDSIITAMGPAGAEITEWTHSGGQYIATFGADGSLLTERQDWQFRIGTPEGTLVSTITSSDTGSWSVDGDQMTIEDGGSEAEVRLQIEVGGQLQDLPIGGTQTVGTDPISGTGTYSCEGDVLTAMVLPPEETVMVQATWDRIAG